MCPIVVGLSPIPVCAPAHSLGGELPRGLRASVATVTNAETLGL